MRSGFSIFCSVFGMRILIALFIKKPSVALVCATAFSVPTFKASCSPEPILASFTPPTLGKLPPSPFKTLSNCADAGEIAKRKKMAVAHS